MSNIDTNSQEFNDRYWGPLRDAGQELVQRFEAGDPDRVGLAALARKVADGHRAMAAVLRGENARQRFPFNQLEGEQPMADASNAADASSSTPEFFRSLHSASDVTIEARRALRNEDYTQFADIVFAVKNRPDLLAGIDGSQLAEALPHLAKDSWPDFVRTFEVGNSDARFRDGLKTGIENATATINPASNIIEIGTPSFMSARNGSGAATTDKVRGFVANDPELASAFTAGVSAYVDNLASTKGFGFTQLLSAQQAEDHRFDYLNSFITASHIAVYSQDQFTWFVGPLLKKIKDRPDLKAGFTEQQMTDLGHGYARAENIHELNEYAEALQGNPELYSAFKGGILTAVDEAHDYDKDRLRARFRYQFRDGASLWENPAEAEEKAAHTQEFNSGAHIDPTDHVSPNVRDDIKRKQAEEARKRGTHFAPEEFDALKAIWSSVIPTKAEHTTDYLRLHTQGGGHVQITRDRVTFNTSGFSDEARHEAMRCAALHAKTLWNGKRDVFGSQESQLWALAYGKVYGVETFTTAPQPSGRSSYASLPQDMIDRLPAMMAQIRAMHPDAPAASSADINDPSRPADRRASQPGTGPTDPRRGPAG